MKFSITPVAVAVTLALGAVGAHAATLPTYGATSPADGTKNDGLYLAVWDDSTKNTDLVDLTSVFKDVALTTAAGAANSTILTTPTPGTNGWATVSNFQGFASVDQLDLGTISNFSSVFPSTSSSTNFIVVAGNNGGNAALTSAALTNTNVATSSMVVAIDKNIISESSTWTSASTASPLKDIGGAGAYSAIGGPLGDGNLGVSGDSFGVKVGSAAGFYEYTTNTISGATATTNYTFNGQQGFWFLSSTGDLSWNLVASTVSSVPLPPAVWLFASGLIGLGLIGRRRQNGLGAAA